MNIPTPKVKAKEQKKASAKKSGTQYKAQIEKEKREREKREEERRKRDENRPEYVPISITYGFADKPEASKPMEMFAIGSNFPVTKCLTFKNKLGGMNLLLHYTEGAKLMQGLPHQLASYKIGEGKLKHAE